MQPARGAGTYIQVVIGEAMRGYYDRQAQIQAAIATPAHAPPAAPSAMPSAATAAAARGGADELQDVLLASKISEVSRCARER